MKINLSRVASNKRGLDQIVGKLSRPDSGAIPIDVVVSDVAVELIPASESQEAFAHLSELPSYVVPRKRKASQIRRLMKFARLLTNDDIDEEAVTAAKKTLIQVLDAAYNIQKDTERFKQIVLERATIEIQATNWDIGTAVVREGDSINLDISSENIEDLFEAAGRKLNEGLHKSWWRARVDGKPDERDVAKLELFALSIEPDLIRQLERVAQVKVQEWLTAHRSAIASLDENSRAEYSEIRNLASQPELSPLIYPTFIQSQAGEKDWKKHLYVSEADQMFSATLNSAETQVIETELGKPETLFWLRNPPRKQWSLCVPYEIDGEDRAMYPDFLFVSEVEGRIVVDLIEPHTISLADAPAKAAGLAKFAAQHADKFRRIEIILVDGRTTKTFNLADESIRNRVRAVKLPEQLRSLMAEI